MNQKQLGILNALVTFAAENIPGGLSDEEMAVAQTAGRWCINPYKTHNYKVVNSSPGGGFTIKDVLDDWATRGWRLISVISDTRPGYAHSLIFERPVEVSHPDD